MIETLSRWGHLFCSEWVFCFALEPFFLMFFSLVFPNIIFIPALGLEWRAWWVDLHSGGVSSSLPPCWSRRAAALGVGVGLGQEEAAEADLALISIQEDSEERVAQVMSTYYLPALMRLLQYGFLDKNGIGNCLNSTRKEWWSRKCHLAGRSLKSLENLSSWS